MDLEKLDLLQAMTSSSALGKYFKRPETWKPWLTFFKALVGSKELTAGERKLLHDCTGLRRSPRKKIKEAFIIAGRRSGKSTISALLSVFFGVWGEWQDYVARGERPKIFVIATNLRQAEIVLNYVKGILDLTPFLRGMVRRELADSVELVNGVEIVVKPASWRSTRGYTTGLIIMEEMSFWRFEHESALRDKEVYVSLKPGTTTIKNSLVLGISSPFSRHGLLFEKYRKHYAKDRGVLVWQAPTWTMNPTLTKAELEAEFLDALGESEFASEYGAQFRDDIESFLPADVLDRAIANGREMLRPALGKWSYYGFADPSEGLRKGGDSMTFAIAHREKGKVILDRVLEFIPPFDPINVVNQIANTAKEYGIQYIIQDRHAIGWIAKDFRAYGIQVEVSEWTKSEVYERFSVLMNKNGITLLDNKRLRYQLSMLQRFLRSGGSVKIDHYSGGKDDVSNACAGVCVLAESLEHEGPIPMSVREAAAGGSADKFDQLSEEDQAQVESHRRHGWLFSAEEKEKSRKENEALARAAEESRDEFEERLADSILAEEDADMELDD